MPYPVNKVGNWNTSVVIIFSATKSLKFRSRPLSKEELKVYLEPFTEKVCKTKKVQKASIGQTAAV